jgi:hypothetical protein
MGKAAALAPSADLAMQEAILGALVDAPELLDNWEGFGVEPYMTGDFALSAAALHQHGSAVAALDDIPATLRDFVSMRIVEPLFDAAEGANVIRGNVKKLRALEQTSTRETLLDELKKAESAGDNAEFMRILVRLDELKR